MPHRVLRQGNDTFLRTQYVFSAASSSQTENQDAIDSAVVQALGDVSHARAGIELLDFNGDEHDNEGNGFTGLRHLDLGDDMYLAKVLKDGVLLVASASSYRSLQTLLVAPLTSS